MVAKKSNTKKQPLLETDLYGPVRDYLIAQGYTVRSEVRDCDVTATKDDELIIIELKLRFNLELLYQSIQRQKLSDSVYVAIPRPPKMGRNSNWKDTKQLLRRLELGLIIVSFETKKPHLDVVFHPTPPSRRKNHRRRSAVIREIEGRSTDHNQGGSTRRKLLTAYRESSLRIATYLDILGPASPKKLREMNTGPKTQAILYNNVYGWFERTGHALYSVKPAGRDALEEYSELVSQLREEFEEFDAQE